jgi:hypothetical protein
MLHGSRGRASERECAVFGSLPIDPEGEVFPIFMEKHYLLAFRRGVLTLGAHEGAA